VWLKSWSRFYRNQSLWTRRPRKKLIAGIVLTGGGAQLKHIKQLVEYITGMDTRIGYPNEHLAGDSDEEFSSPLYAQG
jgi:cell division protein FtsA